MIKVNLLPGYLAEFRRLRIMAIVFLIVCAVEAGIGYKWIADMKAQTDWYTSTKGAFEKRTADINEAQAKATALAGKVKENPYDQYINFFSGNVVQDYLNALAMAFRGAGASALGKPGATVKDTWYNDMKISGANATLNGEVKGLINLVDVYYNLKDAGFTLAPVTSPRTYPDPMDRRYAVTVSGGTTALPGLPQLPDAATWEQLYPLNAAPAAGGRGQTGGPTTPGPGPRRPGGM